MYTVSVPPTDGRADFFHRPSWNVVAMNCCKAGSVVRTGCCATAETKHQKAGRGLTSCSPLHINWKGMKCQACFHHSETVKTLPPPPPTNQSPLKPSPPHHPHTSHSQQPPTAMTKLFSSLPRFASPDKNLQRSPDSVRKHTQPSSSLDASLPPPRKYVFFFTNLASVKMALCVFT